MRLLLDECLAENDPTWPIGRDPFMTPISDTQEFARRFNEEEAIWQRYQEKRLARRLPRSDSPLPESVLDHLDWLEAEREIRITRAVAQINRLLPETSKK